MPRVAFRDNAKIAAACKANSGSLARRRGLTFGAVLIYCLLLSGLVGKSHLFFLTGYVWRVQMAVVAAAVIVGVLFSVWKRSQRRTCQHGSELPLGVKACLGGLLAVAIGSCVVQENWLGNLAFLFVFAGMVYIVFVNGADLMRGISKNRCIDLALLPLCIMVVGSLPSIVLDSRERFFGLYYGAIVAGQMFGLTCLLLFWKIIHTQSKKVWAYWALLSIAILCLVLTRTRTDIFGTPVGMIICLYAAMRKGAAAILRRRAQAILGLLVLLLAISSIWLTGQEVDTDTAKEYLRISGDYDDVTSTRLGSWETGMRNVSYRNIFGKGPLARFGSKLSTQESGYVRELSSCNSYLAVFQAYGWPGGILFIIFLVSVGSTFLKRRDPYATLGLSLLVFGLVNSTSENWLLSFGSSFDVYSWFILGLTLTYNSSNSSFGIADNRYKI